MKSSSSWWSSVLDRYFAHTGMLSCDRTSILTPIALGSPGWRTVAYMTASWSMSPLPGMGHGPCAEAVCGEAVLVGLRVYALFYTGSVGQYNFLTGS